MMNKKIIIGLIVTMLILVGGVSAANVSVESVNVPIPDTSITATTYTTVAIVDFNTTTTENFTLITSLNAQRLGSPLDTTLIARVLVNDAIVNEQNVRSFSSSGEYGVTSIDPTFFELGTGEHNMTIQFRKTVTQGSVLITNMSAILQKARTTDDDLVNIGNPRFLYGYNNVDWEQVLNGTGTKLGEGMDFSIIKKTITATGTTVSAEEFCLDIENPICDSPVIERYMSSASDIGSVSTTYIFPLEETGPFNFSFKAKSSTGETVTANITSFTMSLESYKNNTIQSDYVNNPLFNDTLHEVVDEEWFLLDNITLTLLNGTGLFMSAVTNMQSITGAQTTETKINISAGQSYQLSRTLSSNDDIGNVYLHKIAENLTVGNTYTIELWTRAESGEQFNQHDEGLTVFEVTNYSSNPESIAPQPSIFISPTRNAIVCGMGTIEWQPFTGSGTITYNITIQNRLNGVADIVNESSTDTSVEYNYNNLEEGFYNVKVEGCNEFGQCDSMLQPINKNCYDALPANEQGVHIWIFVTILLIVGVSLYLDIKFERYEFGILASVLMIVLAGLIFNGIIFHDCDTDVATSTSYCQSHVLQVPFWFSTTIETIFLILGGFFLILNVVRIYNNYKERQTLEIEAEIGG